MLHLLLEGTRPDATDSRNTPELPKLYWSQVGDTLILTFECLQALADQEDLPADGASERRVVARPILVAGVGAVAVDVASRYE